VIFILVLELTVVKYILIIHHDDHQVVIHLWSSETTKLAPVHSIVQDIKLAMINNAIKDQ
jgi:murein endopeptidase